MNRKYERPNVKQVSKQWVRENCKNITERDLGILKVIHKHRLIRRDQLETLYPEFPSTDFLNKRIKVMYDKHLLDRIYPPVGLGKGSAKQHLCIDRAGAILLDLDNYHKPIITDLEGNKTLPLGWEHKIAINDYKCTLVETCREVGADMRLCWLERPHGYNDKRIIPDITALIVHKGKGYVLFIEVDLGTEDIPTIKKKINSYTDYRLSGKWVAEKWAQVFKTPVFPRVLLFTENGRSKRVNSITESCKESSIDFIFGFHEDFKSSLLRMLNA